MRAELAREQDGTARPFLPNLSTRGADARLMRSRSPRYPNTTHSIRKLSYAAGVRILPLAAVLFCGLLAGCSQASDDATEELTTRQDLMSESEQGVPQALTPRSSTLLDGSPTALGRLDRDQLRKALEEGSPFDFTLTVSHPGHTIFYDSGKDEFSRRACREWTHLTIALTKEEIEELRIAFLLTRFADLPESPNSEECSNENIWTMELRAAGQTKRIDAGTCGLPKGHPGHEISQLLLSMLAERYDWEYPSSALCIEQERERRKWEAR